MSLLSACGKQEYIVPGLTLPPDAVIQDSYEANIPGKDSAMGWVSFNYPGGWDSLERHVDHCLRRAGYRDVTAEYIQSTRYDEETKPAGQSSPLSHQIGPPTPESTRLADDTAQCFRYYRKPGYKFEVTLVYVSRYLASESGKEMLSVNDPAGFMKSDFSLRRDEHYN